jgi:flavin-dependent dehydrogenase
MNVSEKMEHFDVAIIGLGPAGSALARKLAGKMQVIALDKKHQCGTEGFSKPCGGLLAPDAQRSFIRDGLTLPVDVIANPQIFSVKTVDVAASLTRNYQRSYININRHFYIVADEDAPDGCSGYLTCPLWKVLHSR